MTDYVVTGATLIDGTGRDPLANSALWVRDDRIAWVGPVGDLPAEAQQAAIVDAAGRWLIPGLIDAHVHISWNGRQSVMDYIHYDRDLILLEAVDTVRRVLRTGTTTIRDLTGQDYVEMAIRKAILSGHITGPRMRTAGKALTITGGHAYFLAREADGPDEVRRAAREQIKAGADVVKLMATGGAATPGQDVQASQFTLDELQAAVSVAHTMGRTVATHCHGTEGIKNSVLAGVDSIEHGTYLNEECADLMLEKGTAMVFTLSITQPDLSNPPPGQEAESQRLAKILAVIREPYQNAIDVARSKGLFVGLGTDAGGNGLAPHDFSVAREMEALVNAGYSAMDVLTMATRNNAEILRWAHDLGTLESGKLADFVILTADPLDHIRNVRQIQAVYKGGQPV